MNKQIQIQNLREQINIMLERLDELEQQKDEPEDVSDVSRKHIGCIVDFCDESSFDDGECTRSPFMGKEVDDDEFPYESHYGEAFRYAKLPERLKVGLKDHLPKYSPRQPDCVEDGDVVLYKGFDSNTIHLEPTRHLRWEDIEKYIVIEPVI